VVINALTFDPFSFVTPGADATGLADTMTNHSPVHHSRLTTLPLTNSNELCRATF
jgi:hypothetical protein